MMRSVALLLATLTLSGCDSSAQDLRKAMNLLYQGHSKAGFMHLQDLAVAGYAPAQFRLAMLYLQGRVTTKELADAERWLALAADRGNLGAQYYQAVLWLSGQARRGSVQAGIEELERLAEQGFVPAHLQLALFYEKSKILAQDDSKALTWYRSAAERGNRQAIQRLLDAYQRGELGLSPDADDARYWRERLVNKPFSR